MRMRTKLIGSREGRGSKYDEDAKSKNLVLSRIWKDYKDYLRGVPSCPMKGPREWDISRWTYEEKTPFLFSEMNL